MNRIILAYLVIIQFSSFSYGQSSFEYKTFLKLEGQKFDLRILKGKPILLELIDGQCLACFKNMPFMNQLKDKLKDRVEFILLGKDEKKLPGIIEKFQMKYGLKIMTIFDSTLYQSLGASFVPFYVWIDRDGNIVRKTTFEFVNERNLLLFAEGNFNFFQQSTKKQVLVDNDSYNFSINDVLQGSFFSSYVDSLVVNTPNRLSMSEFKYGIRIVNSKVSDLALLAWFGRRIWYRSDEQHGEIWPIVEFETDNIQSILSQRVCYSFKTQKYIPPTVIQEQLRQDLCKYFGLTGQVIVKEEDCWVLKREDMSDQFLRSKTTYDKRMLRESVGGLEMISGGINTALDIIEYKTQIRTPIIDKTGILWLIDLSFEADMTDIEEVKKALMQKGLILTKEKRLMQVLVIKKA